MTNLVILSGNIGQKPETRITRNGTTIANFSLATSRPVLRDGKTIRDNNGHQIRDTEWHRITCFSGLADIVHQHCNKGMRVQVLGRIHYNKWTDNDGIERYGCEIIAEKVEFLSRIDKPEPEKTKAQSADLDDEVPF